MEKLLEPNVIKLFFTSVIYEFSLYARMLVRPGLKSLPGTNALAYYKKCKLRT
jgi:hypothetical protein